MTDDEKKMIQMFQCTVCDFRCSGETYLKMHVSRFHGVKTLSCDDCGLKYAQKDTLRNHQKQKNGIK